MEHLRWAAHSPIAAESLLGVADRVWGRTLSIKKRPFTLPTKIEKERSGLSSTLATTTMLQKEILMRGGFEPPQEDSYENALYFVQKLTLESHAITTRPSHHAL